MSFKYLSILIVVVGSMFSASTGRLSMTQNHEGRLNGIYRENVRNQEKTDGLKPTTFSVSDTMNRSFKYQSIKDVAHSDSCEVKNKQESKTQPNTENNNKTLEDEHLTMLDLLIRWFSLLFQSSS
jgi:hypothetical protein